MRFFLLLLILFSFRVVQAQYSIEVLDSNTFSLDKGVVLSKTSFRGLSVVNDDIIWASGNKGTIARSIDGGKTFTYNQLKGYEKSDFRDIEAFDEKRAVIMSSGTPAYILKTADGGQTWKEVYKNTDTAYFLDAMDFWDDKRGMLVGDPINGHFVLLQTIDGGETWQELDTAKTPKSMEEEAVFAASGTSLRCFDSNEMAFVTGGAFSNLYYLGSKMEWMISFKLYNERLPRKIVHTHSQGAFSLAVNEKEIWYIQGDYLNDTAITNDAFIIKKNSHWVMTLRNQTFGYRSCIEYIDDKKKTFITSGTNGIDITMKKIGWVRLSNESFNVVRKAKKGKAVFLAGDKGRIAKLIYSK